MEETPQTLEAEKSMNSTNIVDAMKPEVKGLIADKILRLVMADEETRKPWMEKYEHYLKMALQLSEKKTFPWPGAANVKFPLLTVAALQFQARAMPAIIGDGKSMVRGKVLGYDPGGLKAEKAERIAKHMTYQLLDKIENWEADTDKLLLTLPICGTVFRKVYWDDFCQKTKIDLLLPDQVVVNYWAKDLDSCRRITHKYNLYHNDFISRQRAGTYSEEEIPSPSARSETQTRDTLEQKSGSGAASEDGETPHEMYEVHTYWDMDEDGYEEPWIFTIEKDSRMLVRAVPNFDIAKTRRNAKGEIIEYSPNQYFVKYGFIPSPDGGFYDVGFGILLGSLNDTASTAINQLLDAGTMATTGGGLVGKGLKIKGGALSFAPNEWKQVSFSGDDIKKMLFPLPVREPSPVLLSLLQLIAASGKEIISISEISTGKLPGQNTPATTTLSSIEEGLKLFNSIYKRIWRAEKKELQLLFRLNKMYTEDEEYFTLLDFKEGQTFSGKVNRIEDYNDKSLDVIPIADPNTVSDAARLIKAQQLVELIPTGAVDPVQAGQRILRAMDQPNPQELIPKPQPDPKAQQMQMKGQMDMQKAQMDMAKGQQDMEIKKYEANLDAMMRQMELKFKVLEQQMDLQAKQQELGLKNSAAVMDLLKARNIAKQKLEQQKEEHSMKMLSEADKMVMQREKTKLAMKEKKASGNQTT